MKKEYTFKDLEKEILAALKKLDQKGFFGAAKDKKLTVVDGFVYLPIQDSVGGGMSIGGRNLPTVLVIDDSTGRTWQLSLKQLVPDVEL